MIEPQRITEHRGSDDLLTGGLGLEGLRSTAAPAFADSVAPTPAESRRRALWSNWRGIADLSTGGGYGSEYGSVSNVPGREFAALATLPGARQPHRVLVQVPDAFDRRRRCVVVTASSGSRGIYGSIAVAGAWGLPRGYAVAYTDKGAGTDYFDLDTGTGVRLDGTRGTAGEALAFMPEAPASASGVAFKHAHSADHPEADWGRHVKQAAEFALAALSRAFPDAPAFTFDNTRVIAVGLSNGGGAVLRAAELDEDWLDAAVAASPNVFIDAPDARALYDYATQAALLMPGALLHLPTNSLPEPSLRARSEAAWQARCASLRQAGLISGDRVPAQAASAYGHLRDSGWTEAALAAGALSVGFDLWRAVAVTYSAAYARAGVAHPCGYRFSAQAADGSARAATAAERAAWFADGSGIPPGAGVGIVDPRPNLPGEPAADPAFTGLKCLRQLLDSSADQAFAQALAATAASPPRERLPVVVIHGLDDGLILAAFSSAPYVAAARAAGRRAAYWQVRRAQHFDAFLALPAYAARYVAMLPYVYAALDQVEAYLDGRAGPPADAVIEAVPRGTRQVQAGDFKFPAARASALA
ncbi:MAG TPA: 3-hydroxybutyrate oligomer hydrolase family protein [Roseococcus sp.]|nr:3-hydroxybutyrate oligomer hydrolase family protein [Roseococcus sp.]